MIHETVGTVSTASNSKPLENDSNLANSDFSIGSLPREGRSQATPNVIQETVMSTSASSSTVLVGNESVVEKSRSIDNSFGSLPKGKDFRRPQTPTIGFLSKKPRGLNKSQPKQPTVEIPSPKVTQSQPTKQVDDDDLFNFEEDDGDKEKTKSKRKRSVSTEQIESHSKKTKKVQGTTTTADKPETRREWKSIPGKFLSKSSLSPKSLSIDSSTNKVVDEEITRSFMTLEVRPLVLVKTNSSLSNNSSNASSYTNNNKKNVKTFKKQTIGAKPNKPIPCTISVTSSVANLGTLENAMEITAQIEENQETRAASSRRPNPDPEEDIWNFEESPEQRPASRKRKR